MARGTGGKATRGSIMPYDCAATAMLSVACDACQCCWSCAGDTHCLFQPVRPSFRWCPLLVCAFDIHSMHTSYRVAAVHHPGVKRILSSNCGGSRLWALALWGQNLIAMLDSTTRSSLCFRSCTHLDARAASAAAPLANVKCGMWRQSDCMACCLQQL